MTLRRQMMAEIARFKQEMHDISDGVRSAREALVLARAAKAAAAEEVRSAVRADRERQADVARRRAELAAARAHRGATESVRAAHAALQQAVASRTAAAEAVRAASQACAPHQTEAALRLADLDAARAQAAARGAAARRLHSLARQLLVVTDYAVEGVSIVEAASVDPATGMASAVVRVLGDVDVRLTMPPSGMQPPTMTMVAGPAQRMTAVQVAFDGVTCAASWSPALSLASILAAVDADARALLVSDGDGERL
jgi:hypothetical protein